MRSSVITQDIGAPKILKKKISCIGTFQCFNAILTKGSYFCDIIDCFFGQCRFSILDLLFEKELAHRELRRVAEMILVDLLTVFSYSLNDW